ncbi:TIP41-like family-domain-containing protein [Nemania sp. FL0916]|nr:TIP41-like family-domain-containing protein [Nemania sp. FL0916]
MATAPPPPPPHDAESSSAREIQINAITSLDEPWPSAAHVAAATSTYRQGAFAVSSRKLPISKAGPIAALERELGIPVPEMIFGDNLVSVCHLRTGWRIDFAARDALDAVDKTGENMLRVAYARAWSASREQTSAGIRDVVRPFDWSYSTTYRGTLILPGSDSDISSSGGGGGGDGETDSTKTNGTRPSESTDESTNDEEHRRRQFAFAPTTVPIPIELLKRRDPIRFFDDVMLYESELDDNGISVLSVKLRVHDERMLLLCRLYMRLDGVLCRVRDTRVYVDFASEVVTREYTAKEAAFDDVKRKLVLSGLRPDGVTIALRDANQIAEILPIVEQTLESVSLGS